MKAKEILDNNSMIAEFMGGKEVDWFSGRVIITPYSNRLTINNYLKKAKSYIVSELKFHSSWDWLIPVIKKCYTAKSPTNEGWSKSERIENMINEFDIWGDNIINVYAEVVTFVKWYNSQKK